MSITRKRYRRLWLLFLGLFLGAILIGNIRIIAYDLGTPIYENTSNTDTQEQESNTNNMILPERRTGHPRALLFERPPPPENPNDL